MITQNRCAHRRCTTSLQAPRTSAYQAAPSGRNTTTTTLLPGQVLGFPPVRGGAWGRGRPDALQEGTMAPTGVTASGPASRPGFLPSAKHPQPRTVRRAPPDKPPTNVRHHGLAIITAASPWSSKRDRRGREGAAGNEERQRGQPRRRRQPPPPSAVTDRTRQGERTRPSRPGRAQKGLVKHPSPSCSRRAAVSTTPRTSRTTTAPAGAAAGETESGPPRPRWGPKGPRSGPGGRRRHPPRQRAAKGLRRRL